MCVLPFDRRVSVIDLLVNVSPDALAYMLPLPVATEAKPAP
jgi:hypothetical protein